VIGVVTVIAAATAAAAAFVGAVVVALVIENELTSCLVKRLTPCVQLGLAYEEEEEDEDVHVDHELAVEEGVLVENIDSFILLVGAVAAAAGRNAVANGLLI
jgi:hypothetical protein